MLEIIPLDGKKIPAIWFFPLALLSGCVYGQALAGLSAALSGRLGTGVDILKSLVSGS